MLLFFDTETTGFVHDHLPLAHPQQPYLVQLAAILAEEDGTERALLDLIVRPDGWTIPKQASDVHGITTELATRVGVPLQVAIAMFSNLARNAEAFVAHNIAFDNKVIATQLARLNRADPEHWPTTYHCTKELAAPVVNLPPTARMRAAGFTKPKPPTLGECYLHLFGETLEHAHSALVDTRACKRVYLRLKADEMVKLDTEPAGVVA